MRAFTAARESARASSPIQGRPRPTEVERRRQIGQAARVGVPATSLAPPSNARVDGSNALHQKPHTGMGPPPLPEAAPQHVQEQYNDRRPRDNWETDTEHFDDTTTMSEVLTEGGQPPPQGSVESHLDAGDEEHEHDKNGTAEVFEDEQDDEYIYDEGAESQKSFVPGQQQQPIGQNHDPMLPHPFKLSDYESYPPTTGALDAEDIDASRLAADGQGQRFGDQPIQFATQLPLYKSQLPPYQSQVTSDRPVGETGIQNRIPQQSQNVFTDLRSRDRVLKMNTRSDTNLPLRQPGTPPGPSRTQSAISHSRNRQGRSRDGQMTPSIQPHAARHAGLYSPAVSFPDTNSVTEGNNEHIETESQAPSQVDENDDQLVEDYDTTDLRRMPYSDLENESFDFNPRADLTELSFSLPGQPLKERLAHIRREKVPDQQSRLFFDSLTLDEWEDAGDWFLDEFQNLIEKMKTARKEKRKVAREFEEEVKGRNDFIAQKKRRLDEELGSIKSKGINLLPTTPRKKRGQSVA